MTRLRTEDVERIRCELNAYDEYLLRTTGKDLKGIATGAHDVSDRCFEEIVRTNKVCVVPVTSGEGVIEGFSDAVCGIVSHLGFDCFVTENTDDAGMAEACEKRSDIIFSADDDRFTAVNVHTRNVSDNSEMTAKGFVIALEMMAGGLKGKDVLVLGCGDVGSAAAKILAGMDAIVSVCDIDLELALALHKEFGVKIDHDWTKRRYRYIIDATPSVDIIDVSVITDESCIVVPGVPCGLSLDVTKKLNGRYLHDPLQIGAAMMAIDACMKTNKRSQ